jgi:hypothetical protein
MRIARPTVQEERWLALAGRYPALRDEAGRAGRGGSWRTTTQLARVLGFLLGLLATGLLGGVMSLFPSPWLVGGLLLVFAAEWLVAKRRVFHSGIEEALYVCGAVAVVVQPLLWMRHVDAAAGVALACTGVLLAGWRLLSAPFTTLAIAGYSVAVALAFGTRPGNDWHPLAACAFCIVASIAAWVGSARTWQRPAHDAMCDGLVIAMPWCACAWFGAYAWNARALLDWGWLALALVLVAVNLLLGVKRRTHAPFIGALGCMVFAGLALHRLLHWPAHWRLVLDGALLLAIAVALERWLRHREAGITSSAPGESTGTTELLQMAAAAQLAPAPGAAPPEAFHGEGGGFAGGGASGRF